MRYFHCLLLPLLFSPLQGQRTTLSLDGEWQLEDSIKPDDIPGHWTHTAPVPGMANLAKPAFRDVDQYLTYDNIFDQVTFGLLPRGGPLPKPGPRQDRNWFWYRNSFRAPVRKQVAVLKINKAQFSTAVWLNGRKIGDHLGCYTAAIFEVTAAMNWTGDNELIVRVGAHPGVMPKDVPSGTDFEKTKWTPGIYDSVSLLLSDNPVIETVQVAPRISSSEIVVQASLKNYGTTPARFRLAHRISAWRDRTEAARGRETPVELAPGEQKFVTQTIAIPGARLWSPESPFLYTVESTTGGDSTATRFGMREFRFDTATRRAYLNGKVYFLRGSNITLHRFFEDPNVGSRPWDEKWLQKLLVEIPKSMNWNSFRFCIGPAPERWYEIADEAGLLIQNEYFLWTGGKSWPLLERHAWNPDELTRQYGEWLRDGWNHPSIVIWDANNETGDDVFHTRLIPAVRPLDLSQRPWENSYNPPAGPDDPVEDHPYLFSRGTMDAIESPGRIFEMTELEQMNGSPRPGGNTPTGHALILNEYGWLWLLRDGTPCVVSKKVYDHHLGPNATSEDRIEMNSYYLGGLTEYWRAWRNYAGVLHFVYLTFCYANAYTCDNFQDVPSLTLQPSFVRYVREAFKPVGVYINFWQPKLAPASRRAYSVMTVNDHREAVSGTLSLAFAAEDGREVVRTEQPFAIPGLGQQTYQFELKTPDSQGRYILIATAQPAAGPAKEPTLSRRKINVTR